MKTDFIIPLINARITEIDATSPADDDAELYLQGCKEELKRLLGKICVEACSVCGCAVYGEAAKQTLDNPGKIAPNQAGS